MPRCRLALFWVPMLAVAASSCASRQWRPSMETVRPPEDPTVDLAAFLPSGGADRQVFVRTHLNSGSEASDRFPQEVTSNGERRGALLGSESADLNRHIAESRGEEPLEFLKWPGGPKENNAGFFMEFDPPLCYLPKQLRPDQPVVHKGKVRAFNRWGHPARSGTVWRGIWLEGREDVTAGGVAYPDCIRLRTETQIRLRWGPNVDLSEYIWLAPKGGEVKRLERITGLSVPFIIDEAYAYELSTAHGDQAKLAADEPARTRLWQRVAVYLEPLLARPRVAGAIIEYADESAAPTAEDTEERGAIQE